jgi:hypothetical protein
MARWSVTYRLPKATLTDRIEVEATSPLTALNAAKLGLPDRAVIVGYRQLCVVLQKVSADVRECYQHADECRRWAEQAFTAEDRKDFLDMQARWLSLARNYEFAEQLSGFTRGRRRSPRHEGKR